MNRMARKSAGKGRACKGAGLLTWMAALGLGLVVFQAQAVGTGHLEAGSDAEAAFELADKLGHATGGCHIEPVGTRSVLYFSRLCFRLACPGKQLFVKHHLFALDRQLLRTFDRLERLPADLGEAVVRPVAEFSWLLDPEHREYWEEDYRLNGTRYYRVYPWIEGVTVGDLLRSMSHSGFDVEHLAVLYPRIGSLVGRLHRAGQVTPEQPLAQRLSRLRHNDLHGQNIMVTPQDQIVLLDPDLFADAARPGLLAWDLLKLCWHLFFPDQVFSGTGPDVIRSWWELLPDLQDSFGRAYCRSLVGEQEEGACMIELADLLAGDGLFQTLMQNVPCPRQMP